MKLLRTTYLCACMFATSIMSVAQNPIIQNQFSADPTARVFNGKIYLYPSHDIRAKEGQGRPDWFCMEDYHVFSSDNLTDWTDHGMILSQNTVSWVDNTSYSMWAPDCVEHNGKYYFFFPANNRTPDASGRKPFNVGVAIANHPEGPFVPQAEPIKGLQGIDPCVFIDKDGQAYVYTAMGQISVAKLKDNLLELDGQPMVIENLPQKGLKEGPFVFERNGLYYLTIPHVENEIERLEYAIGKSPMGPFKMTGVILDESPMHCWTVHQSIVEYKNQWYLFYHQNPLSPQFDKNRSVCVDSLFFNPDGTIQKVKPTWRGVGISDARKLIQLDRYSEISDKGITIAFNDSTNTFAGWKAQFTAPKAWLRYNSVNFGDGKLRQVVMNASSAQGGKLLIQADGLNGAVIATVDVPKGNAFQTIVARVKQLPSGVHNLFVTLVSGDAEVDWIRFK